MPIASSNPFSQFFANISTWFSRFSLFSPKNIPLQSFLKNHENEYTKDDIARLTELFQGGQILSALLKSPFLHAKELTASVNTLKREGIHIGEILKILNSPYPQQAEMIANNFSIIAPNPQEPENAAYYEKFGSPNDEFSIRSSFFYDTLAQSDLPVGLALMIKKAILKETQPLTQESAQRIIDTITKPKKSIGPAILSSGSPAIKPGSTQSSKPPKETDQLDASESTTQKSRR